MVKPDRGSAGGDEYGNTVSDDESSWMIDSEATAAGEFNREHVKRRVLSQAFQHTIKVFGSHDLLSCMFDTAGGSHAGFFATAW